MIPSRFPTVPAGWKEVTFAKDQPQYFPLPAAVSPDQTCTVLTEWIPTAEELQLLLDGGSIQVQMMTFRKPLQPLVVKVAEK